MPVHGRKFLATTLTKPKEVRIGQRVTLGMVTDLESVYRCHWLRNGFPITGANGDKSFVTLPLKAADMEAAYSVRVFGMYGTETSEGVMFGESKEVKHG